jgi:glycine cleavage system H lipoate-binding protein
MDDFAMRMLGSQDSIKLPKLGETLRQSFPQAELHRDGHGAEVLSPIDGKVLAVNPKISSKPEIANQSPYAEGWLMVIQPTNLRKNLKNLLYGSESIAWMDDESTHLATMLSEESGYHLAATGGEAIRDIYGKVPHLDWNRLVAAFLV